MPSSSLTDAFEENREPLANLADHHLTLFGTVNTKKAVTVAWVSDDIADHPANE